MSNDIKDTILSLLHEKAKPLSQKEIYKALKKLGEVNLLS